MSNPHTDDTFMYENKLMANLESAYDAHSKQDSVTLTDPLVWRITHQRGPAVSRKAAADALRGIDPDVLNEEAAKKQEKAFDEMTLAEKMGAEDYALDEATEKAFMDALDRADNVHSPSHYNSGNIECIDAIEEALTEEEMRGYFKANCIKYLWRERYKNGSEDLRKAHWYLSRLIDNLED